MNLNQAKVQNKQAYNELEDELTQSELLRASGVKYSGEYSSPLLSPDPLPADQGQDGLQVTVKQDHSRRDEVYRFQYQDHTYRIDHGYYTARGVLKNSFANERGKQLAKAGNPQAALEEFENHLLTRIGTRWDKASQSGEHAILVNTGGDARVDRIYARLDSDPSTDTLHMAPLESSIPFLNGKQALFAKKGAGHEIVGEPVNRDQINEEKREELLATSKTNRVANSI